MDIISHIQQPPYNTLDELYHVIHYKGYTCKYTSLCIYLHIHIYVHSIIGFHMIP